MTDCYDSLRSTLILRAKQLSRRLSQVASFLLNHPEDVALNSPAPLSGPAQVPPALAIRVSRRVQPTLINRPMSLAASSNPPLERVASGQVHLNERNAQHSGRLACLGLHSI
jgi:hypothetical protein